MPLSYSLVIATPSSAAAVAERLRATAVATGDVPADTTAELVLRGVGAACGVWTQVSTATPPDWEAVRHDLGITATVEVSFQLSKTDDVEAQLDAIVRLTSGVLAAVPGDAVLHRDYESILLLRRGGALCLSDRDGEWPPRRQAMIESEFTRAPLAFG